MPTQHIRYDSVEDFVSAVTSKVPIKKSSGYNASWAGGTFEEALTRAREGDTSAVEKAQEICASIDSQVNSEGMRPTWQQSACGVRPNVPAFLANAPECMYSLTQTRQQIPEAINIYYSPVVSASVPSSEMLRRGIVVLSLAMSLERVRPVNVWLTTCYGIHDHAIRLKSNPMVLSEAANAMTDPAFFRHLSYRLAKAYGWDGRWAPWRSSDKEIMEKNFRDRLGCNENDIIIPAMHQEEWESGELADPIKYINKILDKYRV